MTRHDTAAVSPLEAEIAAEQAVVDLAYGRIEALREDARAVSADVLALGAGGTHQARLERDVRVEFTERRLARLRVGEAGLLFGRTDDEGGDRSYIGRLAVDDESGDPLVVDWRAPAAEAFYRATGRDPMGLVRRRHLTLRGRRVVGLEDELLASATEAEGLVLTGEGALLAALSRSRTGRMGDIVATIQAEQDRVVRAPLSGVLVVQGGPGTGKTAVVLHRAAYLLYTHRFPLERAGVAVVGPNPIFLRYISDVLPALGEEAVTLTTVAGLSPVPPRATERPEVARLKGDPRMAALLANAVADRQRPLRRPAVVLHRGNRLVLDPAGSAGIVAAARRRRRAHNDGRAVVERLVLRHLRRQGAEVDDEVLKEPPMFEALERMWPVLTPQQLLHDLFGFAALVRSAGRNVLHPGEAEALVRPRSASPAEVRWTEPDLPLLDEAATLLRGDDGRGPWERTFGHVLVDEAQDLSPMQLRMLARRCPGGSMTVVGDLAQATGPWAPASWDSVTEQLGRRRDASVVELTVNYRTPSEVMELAAQVLAQAAPGLTPSRSVRSSGEPPVTVTVDSEDLGSAVSEAVAAERRAVEPGKVAVISPPQVLPALREVLPGAGEGADLLDAPVALLTPAQAKGLEFDSVVIVDPDAIAAEAPRGGRALYLAMTRTTRRLVLVRPGGGAGGPPGGSPASAVPS